MTEDQKLVFLQNLIKEKFGETVLTSFLSDLFKNENAISKNGHRYSDDLKRFMIILKYYRYKYLS